MDLDLKSKWVSALRSGEYKQGTEMLHNPAKDTYCCLGVLCKVMGAEFGEVVDRSEYRTYDYVPHIGDKILSTGDDEELADSVLDEVGIRDQSKLIKMNDGNTGLGLQKQSFAEIADYIEKTL